jgi:hypothetical protein
MYAARMTDIAVPITSKKFFCVTLNSASGVQWVRAKNLAPVYFKETNFDRYFKLIPTSVLRELTGEKKYFKQILFLYQD